MLIEGADANASVTGNESTVPMQLRITGLVEMPNSKTYDATGCFVGLEAWGDVSSERAIVRTRNISCLKNGKTIDMPIKGHVSFRGKNGIKGEVVMRNGKILGWAWGAGFVDGIGQGMERASQPAVGLGATAAAVYSQSRTQIDNGVAATESGNYREPFSESDIKSAVVDSIGQRNSYVKTWGCGGFLNETNIYSRGKSLCF